MTSKGVLRVVLCPLLLGALAYRRAFLPAIRTCFDSGRHEGLRLCTPDIMGGEIIIPPLARGLAANPIPRVGGCRRLLRRWCLIELIEKRDDLGDHRDPVAQDSRHFSGNYTS